MAHYLLHSTNYAYNGHGDTTSLTQQVDNSLVFAETYQYDAFGNTTTEGLTEDENPFRYNGQYTDDETGLIYLRNRYYDPEIGRFISEDPYWNIDNMIYGDEQQAVKYIIQDDKKVYYDKDGKIVKTEKVESHTFEQITGEYIVNVYKVYRTPDICSIIQSGNLYLYCMDNPINFNDASGENAAAILSGSWTTAGAAASFDGPFVYGDAVGLIIGIGGSIIAGGVAIYDAATGGSKEDAKDTTKDKDSRLKGNPGSINEERNSKTKIGSDGRAVKERHYSDHGNPSKHTNPHDHDITWDSNGNPQFGPPINYPNGAPAFK